MIYIYTCILFSYIYIYKCNHIHNLLGHFYPLFLNLFLLSLLSHSVFNFFILSITTTLHLILYVFISLFFYPLSFIISYTNSSPLDFIHYFPLSLYDRWIFSTFVPQFFTTIIFIIFLYNFITNIVKLNFWMNVLNLWIFYKETSRLK